MTVGVASTCGISRRCSRPRTSCGARRRGRGRRTDPRRSRGCCGRVWATWRRGVMARKTVAELCREAAWSQWVALGVSGNRARLPRYAVDVEAAIAFAPALNELEPRLFEEVVDWCSRFAGGFVSLTRLKQVLDLFAGRHRPLFDRFAAIINRVGHTKWPTTLGPQPPVRLTGKSRLALNAPATIQLRARKTFGISARSDMIVALLLSPGGWTRTSMLANLGYTRRAVMDALG